MLKPLKSIFVAFLIFMVGCTDTIGYADDEVAAIVRGEEITIGELRFLYTDDKVLEMIEPTVKAKLAVQEAKEMNMDVSEQVEESVEFGGELPPEDVDTEPANSVRDFAESQANKLGMDTEEYYKKYVEKNMEVSAYVTSYFEEKLGEPTKDNFEEYNEQTNQLLQDLVEENEDEIEILIK
ncbi:hypothetical protein [Virgibacillus doumboii]|uniref:hypothetical protein n=1 Tax=Virgibacillus doumboii TaxID=2697503 RepID=UPI0013DEC408|nr:hypothetical protein [Virgibacillus doumboii]